MDDPLRLAALASLERKEYGSAVSGFLTLLSAPKYPVAEIEADLVYAICIYVTSLSALGHCEKARWLWTKAIEIAGDRSELLLYSYAKYLSTSGDLYKSLDILERCRRLNPSNAAAIETAENIKGLIVDRWHFRMLNDKVRNLAYLRAIQNAVKSIGPDCTVLDIGGGTGLLSIYAVLSGCKHVYCCELNRDLADVARASIAEYGAAFAAKVTVISRHSKDLFIKKGGAVLAAGTHGHEVGATDEDRGIRSSGGTGTGGHSMGADSGVSVRSDSGQLPRRVDLIVTELVDSGLLGEHILESLRDARERLLTPLGRVIPHSATVFGYPVESLSIAVRQKELRSQRNCRGKTRGSADMFHGVTNRQEATVNVTRHGQESTSPSSSSPSSSSASTSSSSSASAVASVAAALHCTFDAIPSSKSPYTRPYPLSVDEQYTCESLTGRYPFVPLCAASQLLEIPLSGNDDGCYGSNGTADSVRLSVCLHVCTSVCTCVCMSGWLSVFVLFSTYS